MRFPFEAVLFDMDGTLADTTHYHCRAWMAFARQHLGEELAENDPRFMRGRTHNVIASILGRNIARPEANRLHDEKELCFQSLASGRIRPFPGVRDYLRQLRQGGVRTGLVSNAPRMNIDFILRELGLSGCFDMQLGAEDVAAGKPDPLPFAEACRWMGVSPPNVLVHEDSEAGITSALLAGCPVAAKLTGMSRETAQRLGTQWAFNDYAEWMRSYRFR